MSSMPREALKTRCLETRFNPCRQLLAQGPGARDHFLWIGNVGRRDFVYHVCGRIAQHAFSADIENLNDAFSVGGDTREIGAVENRILQGAGFKQGFLTPDIGNAFPLRRA